MERATLEKSGQAAARATQPDSRTSEISTQETAGSAQSQKTELERLVGHDESPYQRIMLTTSSSLNTHGLLHAPKEREIGSLKTSSISLQAKAP